jgi:hypothetical protein
MCQRILAGNIGLLCTCFTATPHFRSCHHNVYARPVFQRECSHQRPLQREPDAITSRDSFVKL